MTLREEFDKYFEEIDFKFFLFPEKIEKSFNNLDDLEVFIDKEIEFWNQFIKISYFHQFINRFNQPKSNIANIKAYLNQNNLSNATQHLNAIKTNLSSFAFPNAFSNTTFSTELLKIYNEDNTPTKDTAIGFSEYCLRGSTNSISNFYYFQGYMKAYTFQNPVNEESLVYSYKELLDNLNKEYINKIDETNSKYFKFTQDINETTSQFKSEISMWSDSKQNEISDLIKKENDEMIGIKKAYNEHLRLKAPAQYWKRLERQYKKEGFWWMTASIILTLICIWGLIKILYNLPLGLQGKLEEFNIISIRSLILLTLIVSLSVYLIRLFVKLSISAYHLARDAQERYQL